MPSDRKDVFVAGACECCGRFKSRGPAPKPDPECPYCGADARELSKMRYEFINQLMGHVAHGGSAIDFIVSHRRARDQGRS